MCIIIYTPDGNIPKKHLHASLENNPDGWGVMYPQDGKVQIVQGMVKSEFFYHWKWLRSIKAPKVFHARICTHGNKDMENCHPFMVPGHGELAVAHNGVIFKQAYTNSTKSDTRHFVENILSKLPAGFMENEAMQDLLADYIGHSKLVFMSGDGSAKIVNADMGKWLNGLWYSNNTHIQWQTYNNSMGFQGKKYEQKTFPGHTASETGSSSYSLLPDRQPYSHSGEPIILAPALGAPSSQLPEHYRNIGASKGLICCD